MCPWDVPHEEFKRGQFSGAVRPGIMGILGDG
jgi:hypothetical protein